MIVKKVLVAIDFSATSHWVLDAGRTLADALGGSLHLLHVVGSPLGTSMTAEHELRDACAHMNELLDAEDRTRRQATLAARSGAPAYEIARYARENAIDLIVMGTHRHGPTFRMATGSIAEAVLGAAPCAVLAVKGLRQDLRETLDEPALASASG